jgi:hypothetical protein
LLPEGVFHHEGVVFRQSHLLDEGFQIHLNEFLPLLFLVIGNGDGHGISSMQSPEGQ